MGEVEEEQKVVCRFCNKICKNGKSLGGHMRSHLDLIAAAKNKNKLKPDNNFDSEDNGDCGIEGEISVSQSSENLIQDEGDMMNLEMEDQDQDQENHVLRKNPKKSWKNSDSGMKSCRKKRVSCRECSKKFRSSRALAVHMRTHSTMSTTKVDHNNCSKCGRNFDSKQALSGHMKSHSKKSRVSADQSDCCLSDFEFYHPKKKRSITRYRTTQTNVVSFNEVDEEAAVSLIMLSMGIRDHQESSSNGNSAAAFCKRDIVKTESIAADDAQADNSMHMPSSCLLFSSAYFYCLDKKTEHETSVDMCSDANDMTRPSCFTSEAKAISLYQDEQKCVDTDSEAFEDSGKKKEYKCKTCNMVFQSYQALGGHRNRHKTICSTSPADAVTYELRSSDEAAPTGNSTTIVTPDVDLIRSSVKYECQICFKIFPSGYALGGHKRAHYNVLNGNRIKDIGPTLDLNLPVTTPRLLNTNRTDDNDTGMSLRSSEFAHQCEPMVLVM